MAIPWTSDGKKTGAPSSMDVLMGWLLKPGKYDKWETQKVKAPLTKEIVKEMEANGIKHRTPRCVYFKIYNLKRHYKEVKKWLEDKGQLGLFRRGEATEKIEAAVLQRCPQFRELAALFDRGERVRGDSDVEEQEEDDTEEFAQELSDVDDDGSDTKSDGHVKGPQGKRKLAHDLHYIVGSSKRGKRGASKPQTLGTKQQGACLLLKSYPVGHSFRDDIEAGGHDGRSIALSGKAEEELVRLIKFEVKRKEALAACHLEGEKKREELKTKVETIISRHKLKRAGYSEEVVNDALPL